MTDVSFYLTRMGRTYYEHTLPELVRQLQRLNEKLAALIDNQKPRDECAPAEGEDRDSDPDQET